MRKPTEIELNVKKRFVMTQEEMMIELLKLCAAVNENTEYQVTFELIWSRLKIYEDYDEIPEFLMRLDGNDFNDLFLMCRKELVRLLEDGSE